MLRCSSRSRCLKCAVAAAAVANGCVARSALAYQAFADGQAYLQLYSVQGLYGAPVISRQRLTYNLGLDVLNIAGDPYEREPWVTFKCRLRMDSDYGISPAEQDPTNTDYFVPGLKSAPLDIMYAYLEGGGWVRDTLGFRLGRQYFIDELGWWSLDGMRIGFSPGHLFELAGYAGYEQRGGLPLMSSSRFEAGGVFRGNRDGLGESMWPSFLQSNSLAPALGGSLSLLAVPGLRARLIYRRVWQRDQVATSPFLDESGHLATTSATRVSTDRLGIGLGYDLGSMAGANGAAVYDLYRAQWVEHRVALQARLAEPIHLNLSYQYRLPTYDADSIFNWFGAVGSTLLRARLGWDVQRNVSLGALVGARFFASGADNLLFRQSSQAERNGVAGVDANWSLPSWAVRLSQTAEIGDAGDRWIADAWVSYRNNPGRWEPSAILSVAHYRDRLQEEFDSTVLMYVLACRFSPYGAPRFGVDWEHSISDVSRQRFRVVGTVDVRWP